MGLEDSLDEQGIASVDGASKTDGGVNPMSVSIMQLFRVVTSSIHCDKIPLEGLKNQRGFNLGSSQQSEAVRLSLASETIWSWVQTGCEAEESLTRLPLSFVTEPEPAPQQRCSAACTPAPYYI
jgi:hypothetical protein